jgi:hypothetical protein
MRKVVRVTHEPTKTVLAEGPLGWGITPFEGNLYIRKKYLKTAAIRLNFIPGLCIYKFLYMWMDLRVPGTQPSSFIGWKYVLPNPLLPFIWFRTALPRSHPELRVEEFDVLSELDRVLDEAKRHRPAAKRPAYDVSAPDHAGVAANRPMG